MDLTTVKSRLENNFYAELEPCVSDISQVWTNARLYNSPEHTIHKWAEELHQVSCLSKLVYALHMLNLSLSILSLLLQITMGWVAKCKQQTSSSSPSKISPSRPPTRPPPRTAPPAPAPAPPQPPAPPQSPAESARTNAHNLKMCQEILDLMTSDKMRHITDPFLKITTKYANDSYTPMDLDKIQQNLQTGVYRTAQEFATDFRRMISETYRFCIDKDPLIQQAQELQHLFEIDFAKRIQFTQDDFIVEDDLDDFMDDDTMILKKILAIGKAMELELDNMIKKELAVLEERRFHDAQELVKEIETVPPEVMEDVIKIMQANKEDLQVEADGTVEVSYNDLSAKTISDIRKLLHSKNLLSSQQNGLKSDVKQENMKMDVS